VFTGTNSQLRIDNKKNRKLMSEKRRSLRGLPGQDGKPGGIESKMQGGNSDSMGWKLYKEEGESDFCKVMALLKMRLAKKKARRKMGKNIKGRGQKKSLSARGSFGGSSTPTLLRDNHRHKLSRSI